ncbi:hypothetical protein POVWA2_052520 [Plasmodium ovale wallikeri]|uniref:Uncharacterized protein n=1 Tax=Plasmodium ovale wallikeri TaxID=864142 RepID=A0A1A8ZQJ4_PLAOA|nr:hypothetical protein POVWA1_053250 [Plasmodium ovale wallikeri]SBT46676.1 hypothetical protein POVWA2_052520 [Plasmodium ovale wallikeri]
MTIEDVKKLKPYWNVQIANFKENSNEPVFTLLQMAILLNKKTIVGYLLARRGLDINALSRNNQTALMIACEKKVPLDWIEAILKKGGDLGINIKDDYEETALDKCNTNSKAYHLLLKYGALENVKFIKRNKARGNLSFIRKACYYATLCHTLQHL